MLNWMLMGTLTVQVYVYFERYMMERIALKLLVYGLFCLDMAQTVLATHVAWFYMILNPVASPSGIKAPWSASALTISAGLVSAVVQIFYGWRISTLDTSMVMRGLVWLIVLMAVGQFATVFASSVLFELAPTYVQLFSESKWRTAWLILSAVEDLLITACMTWILGKAKSDTMWAFSNSLFTRLITMIVSTDLVTTSRAGVNLLLLFKYPNTNYFVVPLYVVGKLYTNSLMVMLNARTPTVAPRVGNDFGYNPGSSVAQYVQPRAGRVSAAEGLASDTRQTGASTGDEV